MKKIKLPPLNKIGDYDDFYYCIAIKLGKRKKGQKLDNTVVSMNKDNEKTLKEHIYKKLFVGRNKTLGKAWYDRAFPWHWLNYSPRIDDTVPDGHAIVDEKKFFVEDK